MISFLGADAACFNSCYVKSSAWGKCLSRRGCTVSCHFQGKIAKDEVSLWISDVMPNMFTLRIMGSQVSGDWRYKRPLRKSTSKAFFFASSDS